jgi:glycosyltransferase involved in cell wall biosynthesis
VGSISEYVKDKENGLFLKVKDVNSIIQALDILSNDKSMVKKMSVAARQTIFEQLRPEAYVSKLNNLYAGLG